MAQIKNLDKVGQRIKKAVQDQERIILYGDSDVDGICATVMLQEIIEKRGGKIARVYFSDRQKEGYGLTQTGLDSLSDLTPALLITLDCGIGNFKEAKLAQDQGFELIIIDHHLILEKLPQASLIVDPKQKGDQSSFKEYATAGLVFKLGELLLSDQNFLNSLLELCALATIADRMPPEQENRVFINQGLKNLELTLRPGLQALLKTDFVKTGVSSWDRALRINSLLGAGSRVDHSHQSYLLLTCYSLKEGASIVEQLIENRKRGKEELETILNQVEKKIIGQDRIFVLEGGEWPLVLLGGVASRLCQEYERPIFLFSTENPERISGSVRTPKGINGVRALKACSDFLETYGGHAQACGFSLKKENLEGFNQCLEEYFSQQKM